MRHLIRLNKSLRYAGRGLVRAWQEEDNLKIQSFFALLVVLLGTWLNVERWEWAFLIVAIILVVGAELVNSAVERLVDMASPKIDVYAKTIKDIMAAAVFFSSLGAVILGALVFLPRFVNFSS